MFRQHLKHEVPEPHVISVGLDGDSAGAIRYNLPALAFLLPSSLVPQARPPTFK